MQQLHSREAPGNLVLQPCLHLQAGEYTCLLQPGLFPEHCYTHEFPPSVGQLERVADDYLRRAQTETFLTIPAPIDLVVTDFSNVPESVCILANEAIWFGLLLTIHKSAQGKADPAILQKLRECLGRVKCTFHFCGQNDVVKERWRLDKRTTTTAENQTLRGFKRILGYMEVQSELKRQHLKCDAEAVSAWLQTVGVPMTAKALNPLFLVHSRITAASGCLRSIEEMDSAFSGQHFLAVSSCLVMICQRTSVSGNSLLANALLTFVIKGLVARAMGPDDGRHVRIKADTTRESRIHQLFGKIWPRSSLQQIILICSQPPFLIRIGLLLKISSAEAPQQNRL